MKPLDYNKHHIKYSSPEAYTRLCYTVADTCGYETCQEEIDDSYAFAVISAIIPFVVINENRFKDLPEDWKHIIISHEFAHCDGILDEEEADFYALQYCTEEQKDLLIDMWDYRHDRTYDDFLSSLEC